MSLHQLAHHVQSAGRGDDKILVHMTPKEVGGLQALAMAHGGSLTINPETGLPEAGFLSSLLPMIAGFALGPGGFALMSPMQAALTVGAIGTAATGSLGKGLMMGLGAYGGAGMGAGLSNMGTTTPTAAVPEMNVATHGVEGMKSGLYGGQGIFSQGIPPTAATTTGSTVGAVTPQGGLSGLSAYTTPKPIYDMGAGLQQQLTPMGQLTQQMAAAPANPPVTPVFDIGKNLQFTSPSGAVASTPTANIAARLPTEATVDAVATVPQTQFDKLGAGFKKATSGMQGLKDLYAASEAAAPYGGVASLGSLALGSYYDKLGKAGGPPKTDTGMIRPYTYERTQRPEAYDIGAPMYAEKPGSSAERLYFTDKYTALTPYKAPGPEYAAKGGLMGYAVGGPVEQMSAMNAVGDNQMYPQSQLQTPLYSNPMVQRPMPTNVISQGLDAPVDPYTGEQKFFGGGIIKAVAEPQTTGGYSYSYDPQTMQFTQTGTPKLASPLSSGEGVIGMLGRAITGAPQPTLDTGAKVSGGIAPSAVQPAQPTQPAQPAYTPPPIPAYQTPEQQLGLESFYPMMERRLAALGAAQGYAAGGDVYNLGSYSDGGRLLKGPGDGVSDSIPAVIGNRQPARLADGEFVVPARIVSELGNGSTEAGARKLYAMMDRVQKARSKTVGKNKVAANTRSEKYLPA